MKHTQCGFFVTEFLLYLALSACMGLFIMRYIYGTTLQLRATTLETDRIASLYAALDAITNDLEQAPTSVTDWRTILQDELVWQQDTMRVGWQLERGVLKRTMQTYAIREQKWKRPVTHIALEDVEAVRYTPHYENKNVVAFTIALNGRLKNGKIYPCKRSVSLRTSILL